MKYRLLGNSGLKVSDLCLGAMTFGEEFGFGANKDECRRMYEAYVKAGGNFIDTANGSCRSSSAATVRGWCSPPSSR
jgi:aryl-alcohol dehydrogenase-like predicted oxidoreductase